MKNEIEIRNCLNPLLEWVRIVKSSSNPEKEKVIEDFKKVLLERDICGVKDNPTLLDKIFDEIIED